MVAFISWRTLSTLRTPSRMRSLFPRLQGRRLVVSRYSTHREELAWLTSWLQTRKCIHFPTPRSWHRGCSRCILIHYVSLGVSSGLGFTHRIFLDRQRSHWISGLYQLAMQPLQWLAGRPSPGTSKAPTSYGTAATHSMRDPQSLSIRFSSGPVICSHRCRWARLA